MVISPTPNVIDYRETAPLQIRKNFWGKDQANLNGIGQARAVYDALHTFFKEKARFHAGIHENTSYEGRMQMFCSEFSNTIFRYDFQVDIPNFRLSSQCNLRLYSDATRSGNRKREALHGGLELYVHGNYEPIYAKLATTLRFVSEINFPNGMGYECGWDLVEGDKVVRLGRAQQLL